MKKFPDTAWDAVTQLGEQWRAFPNTDTLASYEYFSQTIQLKTIDRKDIKDAFANIDVSARLKVLPLFLHELNHWWDHVGTSWGQNNISNLFNAMNVRLTGEASHYYKILDLVRELKRIDFADYYLEYQDKAFEPWDFNVWKYQFSVGFQFGSDARLKGSHPIFFTRFSTQNDELICRVPFSVSSLLEVSAVNAEMFMRLRLIDELKEEHKFLELANYDKRYREMAYEPLLCVYSTAAHYTANRLGFSNVLLAYTIASEIARFSLRLPKSLFGLLKRASKSTVPEQFHEHFLNIGDRAYIFTLLVDHAQTVKIEGSDWLDKVVQQSGLPSLNEVLTTALSEMISLKTSQSDGPVADRRNDLLNVGIRYLMEVIDKNTESNFFSCAPPILLHNNDFALPPGGLQEGTFLHPYEWVADAFRISNQIREFVAACTP